MHHVKNIFLGVNIDHVATLRQQRGTRYPDPVMAALIAEKAGADNITLHLREDRRHIQDRDLILLKGMAQTPINLEMAITEEMLVLAGQIKPETVCFVPESREELTTEGGLEVDSNFSAVQTACHRLLDQGIQVSLFIDADFKQIEAAKETGAGIIEIHTGHYAEASTPQAQTLELAKIEKAAKFAHTIGLQVNAGHGLHYHNVMPIASILEIRDLNIGHAIIAQAVFNGLDSAVREMKALMQQARLL